MDIKEHYPEFYDTKLETSPDMQLLFFWTSSAKFMLTSPDGAKGASPYNIIDSQETIVGSVGGNSPEDKEGWIKNAGLQEFIVIGSRRNQFAEPTLITLQIERINGVARRINYAEIMENAWLRASYTWTLLIVE